MRPFVFSVINKLKNPSNSIFNEFRIKLKNKYIQKNMLVKLSCMAIVIAIACFQTGYSASLKHDTEETKTSETESESC